MQSPVCSPVRSIFVNDCMQLEDLISKVETYAFTKRDNHTPFNVQTITTMYHLAVAMIAAGVFVRIDQELSEKMIYVQYIKVYSIIALPVLEANQNPVISGYVKIIH